MVNKRCVELHRVGDENWPQAVLWEWIAEDASISYVNEWQVRKQTPIDPQYTECSHWVVNMHKHSELNRWPDRSGLLCMNAPQISLCCISQSTALAQLVCLAFLEQMKQHSVQCKWHLSLPFKVKHSGTKCIYYVLDSFISCHFHITFFSHPHIFPDILLIKSKCRTFLIPNTFSQGSLFTEKRW